MSTVSDLRRERRKIMNRLYKRAQRYRESGAAARDANGWQASKHIGESLQTLDAAGALGSRDDESSLVFQIWYEDPSAGSEHWYDTTLSDHFREWFTLVSYHPRFTASIADRLAVIFGIDPDAEEPKTKALDFATPDEAKTLSDIDNALNLLKDLGVKA